MTSPPAPRFRFCPHCGEPSVHFDGFKKYYCPQCHWTYFHNTAAAVAGIIQMDETLLFLRRNREPGKGLLDLPGGFVDHGEGAEEALQREIFEEIGIVPQELRYIGSYSNQYRYKSIDYATCDMVYTCTLPRIAFTLENSEVAEALWIPLNQIEIPQIAFVSLQQAIAAWLANNRRTDPAA
ncbi:MAG: NUDIX domain-containing protein [Spartobacteria bacterium]|nr:NUDIX domain-containing protein [Spartobacteria bacterium]